MVPAERQASSVHSVENSSHDSLDDYPQSYDRIHLSNIPDYTGGNMLTYLYAMPVLSPGRSSYVTSTCLRNPPRFRSYAHFDNEYIGMSSVADIQKTFHVRLEKEQDNQQDVLPKSLLGSIGPDNLIGQGYQKWRKSRPSSKGLSSLVPRQTLETWLYRLFLKIAIPVSRRIEDLTLIYSPLNLTVFIRLCAHLSNVGYPAHWLNTVLHNICSGKIQTKARPPRSNPLLIREAKADMAVLEQSTSPFAAEMSTLVSMGEVLLPFGILSHHVPAPKSIRRYEVSFSDVEKRVGNVATFVLVLFNIGLLPPATRNLRPYLLSDETSDSSTQARLFRSEGSHVISTWSWTPSSKTASFWMREDVMSALRRDSWAISIWRSDDWDYQTTPEPSELIRDTGEIWMRE